MLEELNIAFQTVGLKMNLEKTKIMTSEQQSFKINGLTSKKSCIHIYFAQREENQAAATRSYQTNNPKLGSI